MKGDISITIEMFHWSINRAIWIPIYQNAHVTL